MAWLGLAWLGADAKKKKKPPSFSPPVFLRAAAFSSCEPLHQKKIRAPPFAHSPISHWVSRASSLSFIVVPLLLSPISHHINESPSPFYVLTNSILHRSLAFPPISFIHHSLSLSPRHSISHFLSSAPPFHYSSSHSFTCLSPRSHLFRCLYSSSPSPLPSSLPITHQY